MFKTLDDLTNKEIYIVDATGNAVADSGFKITNLSNKDRSLLLEGEPVQKVFRDAKTEGSN